MSRPDVTAETRTLLSRFVHRFCPEWLRDQEEDLVQMAVMRVIRSGASVRHPPAYLRQTARTTVLDEVRRWRYRTEVRMSTGLPDRLVNSLELSPETVARGAEVGAQLDEAVATLSDDRRLAVTLFLRDLTIPEIGELLECNRKRASNLVYRGLDDLRKELRRRGLHP